MSVTMDSSDLLLRQVLVRGLRSSHASDSHVKDTDQNENEIRPSNGFHPLTPYSNTSGSFMPSSFTLPCFTPSTPPELTRASPTACYSSQNCTSPFSIPFKTNMTSSPILNLSKIDEFKELQTPPQAEMSLEYTPNMNNPKTWITFATPPPETENVQNPGSPYLKPFHAGSTGDQSPVRLSSLSVSPGLNRSSGVYRSPGSSSPYKYSKFRRSDIKFGKLIGKGGFGSVHEGRIKGQPVAVKIVQKRRGSGIHREILQAERLAFKLNLRHENIVGIYGINMCEELRGDALIVMELVASQSLQALLDDVTRSIEVRERLNYALQVVRALEYLHTHSVVHLDVKPANVLMTNDRICKLSDFGSLTLTGPHVLKEEPEFTQLLGTLPYRAPELMNGLFPSTKADIYSYGITLWQMLTRENPHNGSNPHALIYQVVKWNIRPTMPDTGNDVTEAMYKDLYVSCWSCDMDKRPDAGEIITTVQRILSSAS